MHLIKNCNSTSLCRYCKLKHHSLLHFEKANSAQPTQSAISRDATPIASTSDAVNSLAGLLPKVTTVLLSTALIEILDSSGHYQQVRALIDSGSQVSFITQKCVNRLRLPRYNLSLSVQGIGHMKAATQSSGVTLNLRPLGQSLPSLTIEAVVMRQICGELPSSYFAIEKWSHIKNLRLADKQFNKPGAIDVLLGADVFPQILLNDKITGNIDEPIALNTIFGYILLGRVHNNLNTPSVQSLFSSTANLSLDNVLTKFWELESVPNAETVSAEDALCDKIFLDTIARTDSGRFVVSLPFKENRLPVFRDMRSVALNRFLSLERRLEKNALLYKEYSAFMQEYIDLDHMEPVSEHAITPHTYYIPHHAVLKPDSLTTKLRVVFNASAKSPNGSSLNDTLLIGQKLQRNIVTILLNFRLYPFALTADIKKMYRQILINSNNKDCQRILWRFSSSEPIQDYRLNTVTYGVSSAPYLAIRTLLQLAEEEKFNFPLAAEVISTSTYIDDVVVSCPSFTDAKDLQSQLIDLLAKGGFELRKWSSSDPLLISHLPESHVCPNALSFDSDSDNSLKILGLQWQPKSDSFFYKVEVLDKLCTKRNLLSNLARIFDPLGILAPITFFAKHLIQHLWSLGLDWDEPPPKEVNKIWNQYRNELPLLSKFQLPRCVLPKEYSICEVHGFCDASNKGYASVIYFRCIDASGHISAYFICAKSKVAPIKTVSIPRLELCAAVLLSNLLSYVLDVYSKSLRFNKIFAWSDSQITLTWINGEPHKFKTFVSNRVAFIQDKISPSYWHYVPSEHNPADIASRGCLPSDLLNSSLWWAESTFLVTPENTWSFASETIVDISVVSQEERKICLPAFSSEHFLDNLLNNHSSLANIQRILAYVLRFLHNSKNASQKLDGTLTFVELHNALLTLVRYTQQVAFAEDISKLKTSSQPSKPLRKLNVFLDNKDILRVGGRLYFSKLAYDKKYPALLPRTSRLTELLVESTHKRYFHVGSQTLQFLISQQFWILSPKRALRNVLSKCISCWKTQPKPYQPPMGNLPIARISQIKCFSHTGVDMGGPFLVKTSNLRGAKTQKAYLCLFVCMATKALHLELVSDLSADAFLAAFRRFVARRGRCSDMYSDCGTNFTAAHKTLLKYMQETVSAEAVQWHFNPPSAPHFGGLWEAGIKSVKSHLLRVIGQQILTFEELYTVLVQVEAILNSRPLTPCSSDPNDLAALTPGHFLTLEPLTAPPDSSLVDVSPNRLSRWQLLQRMHQDFWNRWHREYLNTLQQRQKWTTSTSSPIFGTLVLIKNDLVPPLQWSLGRILETHPGADGVTRVATVRTASGTYKRPLVKLCPLPLN